MEKAEARRRVRQAVEALSDEERAAKSEAVRRLARRLPELRAAQAVMGFMPMPDELNTRPILTDLLAAGKRVYVPRTLVAEKRLVPVRFSSVWALHRGPYGILEPDSEETCTAAELDFILVPGRAFDREGNRLGRGAGFYDRFMACGGFRAVRCGIAFACQVLPEVPCGDHDLPVEILVTEDGIMRPGRG